MTKSVRAQGPDDDAPLVDPETGETPPLSPQRCAHPISIDTLPAYCGICWEQLDEGPDAA